MDNGMNLKEPETTDWDKFNPSSSWTPPPPALNSEGKPIIYYAQLPTDMGAAERQGVTKDGYRRWDVGPLTLVKNGNGIDGQQIRFYTVSVKKFQTKEGKTLEVHSAGKLLRAAQVQAKPQKNAEYDQAIKATAGRVVPITIDWRAFNKDTGEEVRGYENFPFDPERPGQRKSILKKGDILPNGQVITSEVLFANMQVRNVIDSKK